MGKSKKVVFSFINVLSNENLFIYFFFMYLCNSACLCPVFSFGENDIWDQADNPKGSKIWKVQKTIQKLSGWTMPLFHGRGVFNCK